MARRKRRLNLWLQLLLMAPIAVSYLIIAMGLLIVFNWLGISRSLLAVGIGHVVINLPLCFAIVYSQLGEHQANIERAAHDLGASDLKALLLITVPMLWPALLAGFLIAATLSWDEFVIAFLLSKFEVTMPVMIWSMLRSGLNPALNAAGTIVFAISILFVILVELLQARSRRHG
jgi:spermidine/putrescine transport system permease protein